MNKHGYAIKRCLAEHTHTHTTQINNLFKQINQMQSFSYWCIYVVYKTSHIRSAVELARAQSRSYIFNFDAIISKLNNCVHLIFPIQNV